MVPAAGWRRGLPRLDPADEADIHAANAATAEADYAALLAEREACRAVAVRTNLNDVVTVKERDRRASARWVHVHMIGEYVRRHGHADLLRKRVDGVNGL